MKSIVLLSVVIGAISASCPSGWVDSPLGKCFFFETKDKATWQIGQGICLDKGGTLATIDSMHAIYWMRGYRNYHGYLRNIPMWIGGYKKDGKWVWKTRAGDGGMVVADWADGEPNNEGGPEDCIELRGEFGYNWNDIECDNSFNYICEMEKM